MKEKNKSTELSLTDREILALLQQDAAMPVAEIAAAVGLSTSPCWRRINRLEQLGYIDKRVALLNREQLGLGVVVFANVRLSAHHNQSLREFEDAVSGFSEVTECYTMTGSMDYLLKIVTRDIHAYELFFREHLSQLPTVQEVHSSIAITQIKYSTELPLNVVEIH